LVVVLVWEHRLVEQLQLLVATVFTHLAQLELLLLLQVVQAQLSILFLREEQVAEEVSTTQEVAVLEVLEQARWL
jgi:hypothetical protein